MNSTRPQGRWFRIILSDWPGLLACANHADTPGTLVEVFAHHVCRNFRPRHQPALRLPPPEPPDGPFRYLPLTKGRQALVDPEDYEWLCHWKWSAMLSRDGRAYAAGHVHGRKVYMHRLILNAPPGRFVDHFNGNGLDNRRCNLRFCTPAENVHNGRRRAGSSRFKGVSRFGPGKWVASIDCGRHFYIGLFADEVEAAHVRDRWAFALHRRFAWLNFPEDFTGKDPDSPEFETIRQLAREKQRRSQERARAKRQKAKEDDK